MLKIILIDKRAVFLIAEMENIYLSLKSNQSTNVDLDDRQYLIQHPLALYIDTLKLKALKICF